MTMTMRVLVDMVVMSRDSFQTQTGVPKYLSKRFPLPLQFLRAKDARRPPVYFSLLFVRLDTPSLYPLYIPYKIVSENRENDDGEADDASTRR